MGLADAGSHADTGIQRAEGGIGGQGIAPDVTRSEQLQFPQDVEETSVGTPWTEVRRSRRKRFFEDGPRRLEFLP
jgi:hypothetical protein